MHLAIAIQYARSHLRAERCESDEEASRITRTTLPTWLEADVSLSYRAVATLTRPGIASVQRCIVCPTCTRRVNGARGYFRRSAAVERSVFASLAKVRSNSQGRE